MSSNLWGPASVVFSSEEERRSFVVFSYYYLWCQSVIKHDSYFKVKGNGTPGQKLSWFSAERSQHSIVKTLWKGCLHFPGLTALHESFGWWHIVSFLGGLWGFGGRQLVFYFRHFIWSGMELWVIPSSISELLSDDIVTLFTEACVSWCTPSWLYKTSFCLFWSCSVFFMYEPVSLSKKMWDNLSIINKVKIMRNKLIHILRLKKLQWWKLKVKKKITIMT